MAEKISKGIVNADYMLLQPVESNQIFAILPNTVIKVLQEKFTFFIMSEIDNKNSLVRLVTSWATVEEKVNEFIETIVS